MMSMKPFRLTLLWPVLILLLSITACRPVITIGWWEIALIGGLIVLLAAPLLIRILRLFARLEGESERESETSELNRD
jgi:hypothetical protein